MKLSEGLEKLLSVIKRGDVYEGLCSEKTNLYFDNILSWNDNYNIAEYFSNNKPLTWYRVFHSTGYWWKPGKVKPRKKWLKKHIKKLKAKGL